MQTELIYQSEQYSAHQHPTAGLIVLSARLSGGYIMKPDHPQFDQYLAGISGAVASAEADDLCRSLLSTMLNRDDSCDFFIISV